MKNLDKLFGKYDIDQLTNGCSTGNNWFGSGEVIESVSPCLLYTSPSPRD